MVHYALYGVNPYYNLKMERCKKEEYHMPVCMEEEKWDALGPKLRCRQESADSFVVFFELALNMEKERTVEDIRRVYGKFSSCNPPISFF